jgi:hypothetical protein
MGRPSISPGLLCGMLRTVRTTPILLPRGDGASLQITKSLPRRVFATLIFMAGAMSTRALFVYEHARLVAHGHIWLRLAEGFAPFFFAALWLLFVSPVITVTCAFLISLQGLWIIWSACTGVPPDNTVLRIPMGIVLCCPAAVEFKRLISREHSVMESLR